MQLADITNPSICRALLVVLGWLGCTCGEIAFFFVAEGCPINHG